MSFRAVVLCLVLVATQLTAQPANAAVTFGKVSTLDKVHDGKGYFGQYDLEYTSVQIFDNDPDEIVFYLTFKDIPKVGMFNDGLDSFAYVGLDYNFDGVDEILLNVMYLTLKSNLVPVQSRAYRPKEGKHTDCGTEIYTNIDAGEKWVGIAVSRSCIGLPSSFNVYGYAEYNYKNSREYYDYAPYPGMQVKLPNKSGGGTVNEDNSGKRYTLPGTIANSSYSVSNFSTPPKDLTRLSEKLLPSVVTVECVVGGGGGGVGTGWSAEATLSSDLASAGYKTIVITNYHVIEECLGEKGVTLLLSNSSRVAGKIVSWNKDTDIAGIATSAQIPALQWIGSTPKQGWWVGVLGSPLAQANILTTGIISSVDTKNITFTITAPINPGNSGGPVFDSTGRVLGLATSMNLLISGEIAQTFNNAQGVPLLCSFVITCIAEKDPWDAVSKYKLDNPQEEVNEGTETNGVIPEDVSIKEISPKISDSDTNRCLAYNGELKLALFNANNAALEYPAHANTFKSLVKLSPTSMNCDTLKLNSVDTEINSNQTLLSAFQLAISSAISKAKSKKEKTITCIKGKLTKKITGLNPKCPKGYTKK